MEQMTSTIVAVDDDEDTLVFLSDFFAMYGILAVPCEPDQFLQCVAHYHPGLIILDIQLNGVSGVDMFQELRAQSWSDGTPVIFFTGSDDSLQRQMPDYAAQGAYLVVKPRIEQLRTLVMRLLEQPAI